jgi:ABC-2 type transport system ATP-binding protein
MSDERPIIRVCDLWKSFDGVPAVSGVSFEISRGSVTGFIGENGAGKTTTMRVMATLDVPDSGVVEIGGFDVVDNAARVRALVGWMPDAYGMDAGLTVEDYLDFYARLCGLRGGERTERLREVIEFSGLEALRERPLKGLSKGMAQRVCLGRALLQRPEILIMDEPAAGLDPKARLEFKNAVGILKRRGVTVFISSHILSELEEMCDSLLFISGGKIVHQGGSGSLREAGRAGRGVVYEVRVAARTEALVSWMELQAHWEVSEQFSGGVRAVFSGGTDAMLAEEVRRMVDAGLLLCGLHPHEATMEEIFVEVLKNEGGSSK